MSSQRLVEYITRLNFEVILDSAKQDCKKLILDALGIALRGSKTRHGKIAANFAKEFNEKKESTVIGYGCKTSCLNAAFANGVMAHAIDFDDDYGPGMIHVGCAVIPVALAMGEVKKISGKDFITAIVGGYDVSCRVASSVAPFHHTPLGYHTTGTANCFGAAAVAGKILELNEDELLSAFGIAGDQAAGLRQYHYDGSMLKHFHAGKAAQNGILATLLAQRGFTGSPQILEGGYGFCKVLSQDHYNLAELVKDLGEEFRVSQVIIKPFPSCAHTHTPIEATLMIQRRCNLELGEMESLIVHTYDLAASGIDKPSPETSLQALLSLQYCIADILVRGSISVDDFWSSERLEDERVREVMKKIKIVEDPELTRIRKETHGHARPAEVEIVLKGGDVLTERVDYCSGSPENPMSELELANKFRSLAFSVLSETKLEKLMNSIMKLEEVGDVRELAELLY
ncbi:2-methylcitrate dehydratase 2 [subsurface metagenome]